MDSSSQPRIAPLDEEILAEQASQLFDACDSGGRGFVVESDLERVAELLNEEVAQHARERCAREDGHFLTRPQFVGIIVKYFTASQGHPDELNVEKGEEDDQASHQAEHTKDASMDEHDIRALASEIIEKVQKDLVCDAVVSPADSESDGEQPENWREHHEVLVRILEMEENQEETETPLGTSLLDDLDGGEEETISGEKTFQQREERETVEDSLEPETNALEIHDKLTPDLELSKEPLDILRKDNKHAEEATEENDEEERVEADPPISTGTYKYPPADESVQEDDLLHDEEDISEHQAHDVEYAEITMVNDCFSEVEDVSATDERVVQITLSEPVSVQELVEEDDLAPSTDEEEETATEHPAEQSITHDYRIPDINEIDEVLERTSELAVSQMSGEECRVIELGPVLSDIDECTEPDRDEDEARAQEVKGRQITSHSMEIDEIDDENLGMTEENFTDVADTIAMQIVDEILMPNQELTEMSISQVSDKTTIEEREEDADQGDNSEREEAKAIVVSVGNEDAIEHQDGENPESGEESADHRLVICIRNPYEEKQVEEEERMNQAEEEEDKEELQRNDAFSPTLADDVLKMAEGEDDSATITVTRASVDVEEEEEFRTALPCRRIDHLLPSEVFPERCSMESQCSTLVDSVFEHEISDHEETTTPKWKETDEMAFEVNESLAPTQELPPARLEGFPLKMDRAISECENGKGSDTKTAETAKVDSMTEEGDHHKGSESLTYEEQIRPESELPPEPLPLQESGAVRTDEPSSVREMSGSSSSFPPSSPAVSLPPATRANLSRGLSVRSGDSELFDDDGDAAVLAALTVGNESRLCPLRASLSEEEEKGELMSLRPAALMRVEQVTLADELAVSAMPSTVSDNWNNQDVVDNEDYQRDEIHQPQNGTSTAPAAESAASSAALPFRVENSSRAATSFAEMRSPTVYEPTAIIKRRQFRPLLPDVYDPSLASPGTIPGPSQPQSLADELNAAANGGGGRAGGIPPELDMRTPDRIFKVVFVGDSAVGKTCFLHRFCHNRFRPLFNATIGVDFTVKTIQLRDRLLAVQLWDTAGQERFRSITKQYFRKADGVVLMYDVTSEASFLNVRNWIESVQQGVEDSTVMCLVGNKVDLYANDQARALTYKMGKDIASEFKMLFFETSAFTGYGINECMLAMAERLQRREEQHLEQALKLEMLIENKRSWCC